MRGKYFDDVSATSCAYGMPSHSAFTDNYERVVMLLNRAENLIEVASRSIGSENVFTKIIFLEKLVGISGHFVRISEFSEILPIQDDLRQDRGR